MDRQQYEDLAALLKMYRLDIDDRRRHAQQANQDAHLSARARDYLKARSNDAYQILVDIETEMNPDI